MSSKTFKQRWKEGIDSGNIEWIRAERMQTVNLVIGRTFRDLAKDHITAKQAQRAAEFYAGNQAWHQRFTRYHDPAYSPPAGQELDLTAHTRYMRRYTMALSTFFAQQAKSIPNSGMLLGKLFEDRDDLLPGIWEETPFDAS